MPSTISQLDVPASSRIPKPRSASTLRDLNVICWALFITLLAGPNLAALWSNIRGGHFLQPVPDKDFVYFYAMGRMLNEYPPAQLYNYELLKRVATEVHPLKGREYTPNPYPPFIGVLFRPFARLPFKTAFLLWQSISFCLYLAGLAVVARDFFPGNRLERSLIFCFALSFLPILWIMMGGQIPTIGFIGLALAFREEHRGRPLLSGLGLSLCLYKPPLLLLFLPMLLISRRYKTLIGFLGGAAALAIVTTAMEGVSVWSGYVRLLLSFGSAAMHTHGYRELRYYMDLASFSSLLPGGRSRLGGSIMIACGCCAAIALVRAWWKSRDTEGQTSTLLWAATLTWTLVLNIYVPIYDSIDVVIGAIATAGVLKDFPNVRLRRQFMLLWILILAASWVTVQVAQASGFQMFTVLFALLGTVQLVAMRRITAPGPVIESARVNHANR